MVVDVGFMTCLCFIFRTKVTNDLDCRYIAVFSSHWPVFSVYVLFLQNRNDEILQSLQ